MHTENLARVISAVLNAPVVCFYVLIIHYTLAPETINALSVLGVTLFLFVIPWFPVLFYWIITKESPSRLEGKRRTPFVIIGLLSYISGAIYFYYIFGNQNPYSFFVAIHVMYIIFSLLLVIGNLRSKPSVHVGGYVAPIILVSLFTAPIFLVLLIITPLIAWSRIKLGIHTHTQLVLGFLLGLISSLFAYVFVYCL